jgi:adenylate cyclase
MGNRHEFILSGEPAQAGALQGTSNGIPTMQQVTSVTVTVMVGDIRDYTVLVQRDDSIAIQQGIRRVFHRLEDKVTQLGGTVKEFRGDAIFSFWEENLFENQAIEACRAALSLDQLARELATDRSVWPIPDTPLRMDWALATGPVTIDSIGGDHPTGLSLIGAPVVLAFRIEKYANSETGPIVVCAATREKALGTFEFNDLGDKHCKGFDDPAKIYALIGPR